MVLCEKMEELLSRQIHKQIYSRNQKIWLTTAVHRVLIANCSSGRKACVVEVCGISLFKKRVAFQLKPSIFSGRVQGFIKNPWKDQRAGFLHTFLECCKILCVRRKSFSCLFLKLNLLWTFQ